MNLFAAPDGRLRPGWRFLWGCVAVLGADFTARVLAAIVSPPERSLISDVAYRTSSALLLLGVFWLLLTVADEVESGVFDAMGLRRQRAVADALAGLLIGFAMVSATVLIMALLGEIRLTLLAPTSRRLFAAVVVAFIFGVGAMAEELAFRGYPLHRLIEAIGPPAGIVVTSVLFSAVHWENPSRSLPGLVNTVAIGVVLGLAYWRSRALWLPWGIHFGWNVTLGLIFGLPVSGLTQFAVLVRGKADGPFWLTGGSYGIEASVVATAVIVLAGIAITRYPVPARLLAPAEADLPPTTVNAENSGA